MLLLSIVLDNPKIKGVCIDSIILLLKLLLKLVPKYLFDL